MEFDFDYVINYIINQDIDFIATITSNWHAVGVDAFLYDLYKKKERKLKGVIIINYHVKSGLCVHESDFLTSNFSDVKFFYLKNPKFHFKGSLQGFMNLLLSKNKNKKVIHIISVIEPSFSSFEYFKDKLSSNRYYPKYVLIDEGFGTYASNKTLKDASKQDYNNKNSFLILMRIYFKIVLSVLKRYIFYIFHVEKRFNLKKKSDKLILNNEIIKSYKMVLNIRNKNLKNKYNTKNKNFIILATTPFSEYNIISLNEEIFIINTIAKISQKNGIYTIIKPHPREINGKYSSINNENIEIINNNFPLEDFLAGTKPLCIIGYISTALVNAKVFYEIDSINISDIALKSRKNNLMYGNEDFKKLTADFILSFDDFDKIEEYLKNKMYFNKKEI